jgi:hypothetical protein
VKRKRLRPAYSPEGLAALYPVPHDHTQWPDHRLRVAVTAALAASMAEGGVGSAADLSCGDGAVLKAVPAQVKVFGDLAAGHDLVGPIEETIELIPRVDLLVCTETLEHLDDPDAVLTAVRRKAAALVLSTPVGAWQDASPGHYWAWSRAGVEEMLEAAGFAVESYVGLDLTMRGHYHYEFGVWGCR